MRGVKWASIRSFATNAARPEPCQAAALTSTGTRRIFGADESYDLLRENARRFFQEQVVPHHDQWELDGQISAECWKEAGTNGLLCLTVPEKYGGGAGDILHSAVVWEEQSYSLCTGPGFSLHSEIVAPYLVNYGTEEQKSKFLPGMASGEIIGAIAMSEPAAGSDLQGMKCTALPDAEGNLILNGSKTYITNGAMADLIIVCAKTEPDKGAKGISLLLVEGDMKGFVRGQKLKKLGLKAQDTSELFFDNVKIPKENILGELNAGFAMLMNELPQERLLIADMAVSAAEAAFELTRTHMHDRKAFGAPLIKQQLLRHRMASMKTELAAGRSFIDTCLELHAQDSLDTATASMAKAHGTDLQGRVADECVQLHGGAGYMWDYAVTKHFADARVQRIYGGSNEIMNELVSRTI